MADPRFVRQQVRPKIMAGGDMVVVSEYVAPSPLFGEDQWAGYDQAKCEDIERTLSSEYPGYDWAVLYDSMQGYAFIMLPRLMGMRDGFFINLKTHEVTEKLVKNGGGLILELYRQRRGKIDMTSFLDARQHHSKLVVPSRPIPV